MNFDGIVINTRTRTQWQAINLGVMIARAWYWPLFLTWIIPSGIITLLLALALPSLAGWLPVSVAWWLKPLWDRGPLFMASRRLFNEPVGVVETLRQLPKLYLKDSLMWLTLRRFRPSRSYDLSVTCLEGLSGKTRSARIEVLHRSGVSEATWTMLLLFHLEMILVLAGVSLAFLFIPKEYAGEAIQFFKHETTIDLILYNGLYFLGMALIAPFYVVCGFSQYINRRIELEGWGIELQFRQLLESHKQKQSQQHLQTNSLNNSSGSGASKIITVLILTGIFLTAHPSPVSADVPEPAQQAAGSAAVEPASPEAEPKKPEAEPKEPEAESTVPEVETEEQISVREAAQKIQAGDVFHQVHHKEKLRFKNSKSMKDEAVPGWLIAIIEFFENHSGKFESVGGFFKAVSAFFTALSIGIEVIFWCLLAAIIIWLVYLYREFFQRILKINPAAKSGDQEQPEILFGLDVRGSSLPENPIDVVKNLWESQAYRDAISLLYRATLIKLINERRMPFRSHFTEVDCFVTVKNAYPDAAITDYFGNLTKAWEMIAYAHRVPDPAKVEMLLAQWEAMINHGD